MFLKDSDSDYTHTEDDSNEIQNALKEGALSDPSGDNVPHANEPSADSNQVLSEDAELDIDIDSFLVVSSTDKKLEEVHLALQVYLTKRESLKDFFQALCAIRLETEGQDANTSALYWLSRKLESDAILNNLLESKALQKQLQEQAFCELFLQALCAIRPETAGQDANTSALYWLSRKLESHAILNNLLESKALQKQLQEQAFCELFLQALCAIRPEAAGKVANTSVLYWLSGNPDGLAILNNLLKSDALQEHLQKNEDFYSLFLQALCARRPEAAGNVANTSVLYGLSSNSDGSAILGNLLKSKALQEHLQKNEDFYSLFLQALCARLPEAAGKVANTSVLYWLSGNPDGVAILGNLLKGDALQEHLQEQAFCELFLQALCARRPEAAGKDANTSVLYWLTVNQGGRAILNNLLKSDALQEHLQKNEDFYSLFLQALCAIRPEAAGKGAKTSAFYCLSSNSDGRAILGNLLKSDALQEHLQKNEDFYSLFLQALCARRPEAAGKVANTSAFYWLSSNPDGRAILNNLLKSDALQEHLQKNEDFYSLLREVLDNPCSIVPEQNSALAVDTSASESIVTSKENGSTTNKDTFFPPQMGIAPKYLSMPPVFSVPKPAPAASSKVEAFKNRVSLQRLSMLLLSLQNQSFDQDIVPISVDCKTDHCTISMQLHTKRLPKNTDKPIYIFAGRKLEAYTPMIKNRVTSNIRVILVTVAEDLDAFRRYVQFGIDCLVIKTLESSLYGEYLQLGSINARRMAAFFCAMSFQQCYKIPHAWMLDDNIRELSYSGELSCSGELSWDAFYTQYANTLEDTNSLCNSIATISNLGIRRQIPNELGSKSFMLNMPRLSDLLDNNPDNLFLLFYPELANNVWGEDAYFQLMLHHVAGKRFRGYHILDQQQYGLVRAPVSSLCCKTVKTAEAVLSFFPGFGLMKALDAGNPYRAWVSQSLQCLQNIVTNNLQRHQVMLGYNQKIDLMVEHARANGLVHTKPVSRQKIAPAAFFAAFARQLVTLAQRDVLRPYQQNILREMASILEKPEQDHVVSHLDMATGTGKTTVEMYIAIAALLAGIHAPILIVTPYQQLVEQAYQDCLAIVRSLSDELSPSQVIQVFSSENAVQAQAIKKNRTLDQQPCILICCQNSYMQFIQEESLPELEAYIQPPLLIIDESHLQNTLINALSKKARTQYTCVIGLSATPIKQAFWQECGTLGYSRQQAVADGFITPCIIDRLSAEYSLENVLKVISAVPGLLKRGLHPNGGLLADKKGIIYVPSNDGKNNYSQLLAQTLSEEGIAFFEVNSDEINAKENLAKFKADEADKSERKVLICKGMGRVGFSDPHIDWIIYLQSCKNAAQIYQSAGRAMRKKLDSDKIAYVISFADVDATQIFLKGNYVDQKALDYMHMSYKEQRQKNPGHIPCDILPTLQKPAKPDAEERDIVSVAHDATMNDMRGEAHTAQPGSSCSETGFFKPKRPKLVSLFRGAESQGSEAQYSPK